MNQIEVDQHYNNYDDGSSSALISATASYLKQKDNVQDTTETLYFTVLAFPIINIQTIKHHHSSILISQTSVRFTNKEIQIRVER